MKRDRAKRAIQQGLLLPSSSYRRNKEENPIIFQLFQVGSIWRKDRTEGEEREKRLRSLSKLPMDVHNTNLSLSRLSTGRGKKPFLPTLIQMKLPFRLIFGRNRDNSNKSCALLVVVACTGVSDVLFLDDNKVDKL